MAHTKRERYETLTRQIDDTRKHWDDLDAKGRMGDITAADVALMDSRLQEWKGLKRDLEAEFGVPAEDLSKPNPNDRLAALASGVGMAPGNGSGSWAKAMTDHLDRIGAKALVPSGSITVPSLSRGIVTSQDRPRSILRLIRTQTLEGTDSFAYLRESVRTLAASTVAAGEVKPTSVVSAEKVEGRVRVIATLSEPVDRFLLDDVSLLRQYLEGSLRAAVELELEDQVLNGAGSTTGVLDDMTGILAQTDVGEQVFATDALTSLRKAITQMQALNIDMGGVAWAMSAATWEGLELTTSDSPYVMGDPGTAGRSLPVDAARQSLWGFPVTISAAVGADTAILGDFGGSVVLFQRDGIRVDWSDAPVAAGTSAFEKNQLVFRCEGRFGLAVTRPAAFIPTALVAEGP